MTYDLYDAAPGARLMHTLPNGLLVYRTQVASRWGALNGTVWEAVHDGRVLAHWNSQRVGTYVAAPGGGRRYMSLATQPVWLEAVRAVDVAAVARGE